MQHEIFISKQSEGTDFKFDTHSYSSHNIQTRCIGSNDKITLFRWRYFIFINLKLLISNFAIECVNNNLKFLLKWNFEILWNFDSFTRKYIHGYWIIKIWFFRRFPEQRQRLFKNVQRLSFPSITLVDIDKIETWKI